MACTSRLEDTPGARGVVLCRLVVVCPFANAFAVLLDGAWLHSPLPVSAADDGHRLLPGGSTPTGPRKTKPITYIVAQERVNPGSPGGDALTLRGIPAVSRGGMGRRDRRHDPLAALMAKQRL